MAYYTTCYNGVLTIHLNGRSTAQQLHQGIYRELDQQPTPVIVILDLTLADNLDQALKAMFFRLFQHRNAQRIGICGVTSITLQAVRSLVASLQSVHKITVKTTESDLHAALGLSSAPVAQPKRLGMLAYLKKAQPEPQL
ncbi:MAG: hypothetical protein ABI947_21105 [Chloroflexota bacterium]